MCTAKRNVRCRRSRTAPFWGIFATIGHYFWDRLIDGGPLLEPFRATFGDERADYQTALQRHYRGGPPAHWERNFISAYATTHPWEDWAESWAHTCTWWTRFETAGATGLALRPKRSDERACRRRRTL